MKKFCAQVEQRVIHLVHVYVQFMIGLLLGELRVGTTTWPPARGERKPMQSVPREIISLLVNIVRYTTTHALFYAQIGMWICAGHLAYVYGLAPFVAAFAQ